MDTSPLPLTGSALQQALVSGALALHYQPLVDAHTGRLAGLEALLRWQAPAQDAVTPAQLLEVAAQDGLLEALGHWVVRRACHDLYDWQDAGLAPVRVALNLAPAQLLQAGLADTLALCLAEHGLCAPQLALQVTEDALLADPALAAATLQALAAQGHELELDRYGEGAMSLAALRAHPFSRVKLDRSCVARLGGCRADAVMAESVTAVAHSLGLKAVAVGVETEAQWRQLRDLHVDELQGHLFAAALPPSAVRALLAGGAPLAAHLNQAPRSARTLLLVDDEANILAALRRLFRRDGYEIVTANSGEEGLALLARQQVDVILSDQRMPGMTGVEFLSQARDIQPDTVRLVLSGYTELHSVTEAVNRGAIYKFLTKPWDDEQLRGHIAEAFQLRAMTAENERLHQQVRHANFELAVANRNLEALLRERERRITEDEISLGIVHEVLQYLPLAIIGVDEDGVIALVNDAAQSLFGAGRALLGVDVRSALAGVAEAVQTLADGGAAELTLAGMRWRATAHQMGRASLSRGMLISFSPV